jgi:hypothetical protein
MNHHRAAGADVALGLGSPRTRRFVLVAYPSTMFVLNFIWEWAQLPLYTLSDAPLKTVVYSIMHCTVGDVLIGVSTVVLAMWSIAFATRRSYAPLRSIVLAAVAMGVGYTMFSEWLNVEIRGAWAYTAAMPRVPGTGTGLAPLLQWVVVPPFAATLAWRATQRSRGVATK